MGDNTNTNPNGEEKPTFDAGGFLGTQPENVADRHIDPNAQTGTNALDTLNTEKKPEVKAEAAAPAVGEAPAVATPKTYQLSLNEEAVGSLRTIAGIGEDDEFSLEGLTGGYDKLKKENESYRAMLLDQGTLVSDNLTALKENLNRSEEQKVRAQLKELGYEPEDVDEQIAIFVANDSLEKQAALVDKKTNAAILAEETSLKESRQSQVDDRLGVNSQAKLDETHATTAKLLEETLADSDGFFGLKFGKNAEEIAANKKVFAKEIANVDYAQKLMGDPKVFAEYAFFQANRETISKVLTSRGVEQGKAIILSEMQNPMKPSQVHEQLAAGEFNATAFTAETKTE